MIKRTRFRPRLVDGKVAGTGLIVVRYCVNADFSSAGVRTFSGSRVRRFRVSGAGGAVTLRCGT